MSLICRSLTIHDGNIACHNKKTSEEQDMQAPFIFLPAERSKHPLRLMKGSLTLIFASLVVLLPDEI